MVRGVRFYYTAKAVPGRAQSASRMQLIMFWLYGPVVEVAVAVAVNVDVTVAVAVEVAVDVGVAVTVDVAVTVAVATVGV